VLDFPESFVKKPTVTGGSHRLVGSPVKVKKEKKVKKGFVGSAAHQKKGKEIGVYDKKGRLKQDPE